MQSLPLRPTAVLALAFFAALLLPFPALAQGGITVVASGEVQVRPDTLVIRGTLTESAEDPEDASVAFRDTRRRALEKLEKLAIDGLSVSAQSLQISRASQAPGMGGIMGGFEEPVDVGPSVMSISQDVTISVAGIDELSEEDLVELVLTLSQTAKEAGLSVTPAMDQDAMMRMQMFGMGGMQNADVAVFKISDPEAAAEAAAEAAIADARAKAERLARLAGVELGPITAIVESSLPVADDGGSDDNYMAMIFGMMAQAEGVEPMTTSKLEDITVESHLTVTFSIAGQ